ncbi:2-dehydropantoate 2-reductase [Allohahella marinimesophila]|uniref:2-dehydropantoate 2-reductase n=1 Tax=Allohahella marinimesophila TaxID=1054972 RepID=A0ABP7PDW3_9GAMM
MAICILGAGSIGCFTGLSLAKAAGQQYPADHVASRDHDIVFVGRQRLQSRFVDAGFSIQANAASQPDRPLSASDTLRFTSSHEALQTASLVLVCVKSGDTVASGELIRQHCPEDALIVSLQNGVDNAAILRAQCSQTVLGGMVPFNVAQIEQADGSLLFQQTTGGNIVVEDPRSQACSPRQIHALTQVLKSSQAIYDTERWRITLTNNIEGVQWSKLLMNLNNAVNALSGRPLKAMLLQRDYRRAVAMAVEEALGVVRQRKVRLARIGLVYPPTLPCLLRLPTPLFRLVAKSSLNIRDTASSSMQDDLKMGRATEVDYINGKIVALAQEMNMDAPINQTLVSLIRSAERDPTRPAMSASTLLQCLASEN